MIRFRVFTKLHILRTAQLVASVAAAQRLHAQSVVNEVSQYPGAKSDSDYQRTGELKDNWDIRGPTISPSGITTRITNNTRYFRWVQGDQQQEQHADTGWKKLSDYLERGEYRNKIQDAINKSI